VWYNAQMVQALQSSRVCAACLLLAACASAPTPKAETAASPAAAPAPAEASSTAGIPADADLVGRWVEFWAPAGRADTQRYELSADGRFDWYAAQRSHDAVTRRFGRFRVERAHDAPAIVLQVEGHEERFGCEGSAACRVTHDPPLEQRLALGACPPNDEAKSLDARYRCISLDGHAFWRGPTP